MATAGYIETPRLLLKDLDFDEHAEGLHQIFKRTRNEMDATWSNFHYRPTLFTDSLEKTKSKLKYEVRNDQRPWNRMYAILLRPIEDEKPRVIGKIGIMPGMACYFHPDFWGKGYATEAAKASVELFWTLPEFKDTQRIKAFIDTNNAPSIKLARRMGLEEGETYRKMSGNRNVTEFFVSRPVLVPTLVKCLVGVVVKTDRFWLQHSSVEEYLEAYHEIWKALGVLQGTNMNEAEVCTLEASRVHLGVRSRSEENPFIQHFAIIEPPTDTQSPDKKPIFMGLVGMHRGLKTRSLVPREPELGYIVHPDFQGQGIATDAVKAYLDYYWKLTEEPHVNVKSIIAIYLSSNIGSRLVLEKSGFQMTAVKKRAKLEQKVVRI